ncbi:MAG: SET domain-containing protein [Gammaproteobacteria bacterium]|nr:SET domain-containing protein [Gammaproteobacteria bacterium]
MSKSSFLRLTICLFFFIIPSISLGKQIIYLLNNTDHNNFQLTKKLLTTQDANKRELITQNLLKSRRLLEVTPELARRIFNLTLTDNQDSDASRQALPRVVVANTGEGTGFGLLALDPIEAGDRIAEYTGEVITS